jgi:hypothetical protein
LDYARELLASSVTPEVLHEAIAEYQIVFAEASGACVSMNNLHPRLVKNLVVIEVYNRYASGPQPEDSPRDGRSPEVKDSHVREVRETALEFLKAVLAETVSQGSGMVRIDQISNGSAGQDVDLSGEGFRDRGSRTALIREPSLCR